MILNRVIGILSDFLYVDPDDIYDDTSLFMEYDLDDCDVDEIISKLVEEFDVEINKSDFLELDTIQDIVEYIEEQF